MGAGINHDICASMVTNGSTALKEMCQDFWNGKIF